MLHCRAHFSPTPMYFVEFSNFLQRKTFLLRYPKRKIKLLTPLYTFSMNERFFSRKKRPHFFLDIRELASIIPVYQRSRKQTINTLMFWSLDDNSKRNENFLGLSRPQSPPASFGSVVWGSPIAASHGSICCSMVLVAAEWLVVIALWRLLLLVLLHYLYRAWKP